MSERARRRYHRKESLEARRLARADARASFEAFCCEQTVRLEDRLWADYMAATQPGHHGNYETAMPQNDDMLRARMELDGELELEIKQ